MPFLFAPPAQPVIPVEDERYLFFPVNRVFGVARNYKRADGSAPEPFYFMKGADTVTPVGPNETLEVPMPPAGSELFHEVELVVALKSGGRNLTLEEAEAAVWGWCVGLDLSLMDVTIPGGGRDLMRGKNFLRSAPVSHLRPMYRSPLPHPTDYWLYVNNEKRQAGSTTGLVVSPFEQIVELSRSFELAAGDIIFTGTPPGASRLVVGDEVSCGVNGVGQLKMKVVEGARP